ncbi:MAG TPA: STAS domain-containing protein [Bryobacteraceae bacterium]|jgi:anti-sigma B factor antagonist|nr:STAS domain-containing protein [Bryobacteraceae bacterium]
MPEETDERRLLLDVSRSGDHIVVRCHGRLVAGVHDSLYAEVKQLIPGAKQIVLDLTDVTNMDSMGLGTIVRLYVSARSAGCDLQLINLGPRVQKLLGVTHLLPILASLGKSGIPYM